MRCLHRVLALALAALLGAQTVCAQVLAGGGGTVQERLRQIEDVKRRDLDSNAYLKQPGQGRFLDGAGAWGTFTYLSFDDEARQRSAPDLLKDLKLKDVRAWYTAHWGETWSVYLRARVQDFAWEVAPGVTKPDFTILQPLDLDLGFVDYVPKPAQRVRAGRQFLTIGRGIALSEILDGVSATSLKNGLGLSAFWATTPNRLLNVDFSIAGFNQGLTHRDFAGLEASYQTRSGNRHYAYLLTQNDRSQTLSGAQVALDFHTNSHYVGAGSTLKLSNRVALLPEAILEGGHTLADLSFVRVPIEASAVDLLALWSLKGADIPLFSFEYGFGSGDPTRASPTNVFGGKLAPTPDESFLYFGRLETGLALSPRLSNLHMLRAGYQQRIRLDHREKVQATDPLLGVKLTEYYKEHVAGGISDPLATGAGRHVGSAADFYLAWRVVSDLAFNAQYGVFDPGNAYPGNRQDPGRRFLASTTWSF